MTDRFRIATDGTIAEIPARVVFGALVLLAILAFVYSLTRRVRVLLAGAPENRFDRIGHQDPQDGRICVRPEADVSRPLCRGVPHPHLRRLRRPDRPLGEPRRRGPRPGLRPPAGSGGERLHPGEGRLRGPRPSRGRHGRLPARVRPAAPARPDGGRVVHPLSDHAADDHGPLCRRGSLAAVARLRADRVGARRRRGRRHAEGRGARLAAANLRDLLVDPPRRSALFRQLPAVLQALPHRDGGAEHLLHEARADGAARHARPRKFGAVRRVPRGGSLLEVDAGRVHLHGVRAVPGRVSHGVDGQAARPESLHRHGARRRLRSDSRHARRSVRARRRLDRVRERT